MITAAARRFIKSRVGPLLVAAGWTWTPPGSSTVGPRLFHGIGQEGAPYPLVVFQMLSPGNDQTTLIGNRIWSSPLYLVKAVGLGSGTDALETVVDAFDHALHGAKGYIGGGRVVECQRVRPHDQPEVTDGKYYSNLGGEYAMNIQEAL